MKQHFALQKKEKITESLNKKPKKANWFIVYTKAIKERDKDNNNIPMIISKYIERKAKISLRHVFNDAIKHNRIPCVYLDAYYSKIILHKIKLDERTVTPNNNEYNKLLPCM